MSEEKKKARIFISHSAHEPEARGILQSLVLALEPDFETLVDYRRLQDGEAWRDELFRMMNIADGAIILFSGSALDSIWVRTEASILSWRHTLDKSFILLPVLLHPLTSESLAVKEFSPMKLDALQAIKSDDVKDIVSRVRDKFKGLKRRDTLYERLERQTASILRGIHDPAAVKDAAEQLGIDTNEWGFNDDQHLLLAVEMLKSGLTAPNKFWRELNRYLNADTIEKLIEMVSSTWVDLRAARWIPEVVRRESDRRLLAVNGGLDDVAEFTGISYVRRACCCAPDTSWPVLPVANAAGEDVVGYYKKTIWAKLKGRIAKDPDVSDKRLKEILNALEQENEPLFVLFHPPLPDQQVLGELRAEFPTLTFFLLTGGKRLPQQGGQPVGLELLEPELAPGEDDRAYTMYCKAHSVIT
jgi:hypothetical protein